MRVTDLNFQTKNKQGLIIYIDNVFSLDENGVYFDWGIENFGFGQFSVGYYSDKWIISNEFLSFEKTLILMETLESAIKSTNDEKLMNQLKCLFSKMPGIDQSVEFALRKIWDNEENEIDRP